MSGDLPPVVPPPLPAYARRRKQVLARWALMPLIPFLVVHFVWGWPAAREKAGDGAIPYFSCQMVGGLFVSVLMAWIAYRLSGRSQYIGSIVFTAFILLFALNVLEGCVGFYMGGPRERLVEREGDAQRRLRQQQKAPTPSTRPRSDMERRDFPKFGFHVDPPPAWIPLDILSMDDVASWRSPDSTEEDKRAFIMILVEETQGKTLVQRATMVARTWIGGHLDEQQLLMDGEPALRVYAPAVPGKLAPVEGLVARHGDRFFLVIGGISPGNTCHAQMEFIREHWKWLDVSKAP